MCFCRLTISLVDLIMHNNLVNKLHGAAYFCINSSLVLTGGGMHYIDNMSMTGDY